MFRICLRALTAPTSPLFTDADVPDDAESHKESEVPTGRLWFDVVRAATPRAKHPPS